MVPMCLLPGMCLSLEGNLAKNIPWVRYRGNNNSNYSDKIGFYYTYLTQGIFSVTPSQSRPLC